MILYKYLNYDVDKTIDTGHTTNANYNIILFMMLFMTFCCKPLKTDPSREMCTYATWVKPFLPHAYPDKLIYISYCPTWKCLILTECYDEVQKTIFNQLFGSRKANFKLQWYARRYA